MAQAKTVQRSSPSEDSTPETRRLTAAEIFQAAIENARDELRRSNQKLAFSGVAGGLTMGLTGLAVASIRAITGHGAASRSLLFCFIPLVS